MTGAALSVKVGLRLILRMARRAIGLARVIERGRLPARRRMARRALTREVIGGRVGGVARQTLGLAGVIETRREPGRGDMTQAALTFEVRLRFILGMA